MKQKLSLNLLKQLLWMFADGSEELVIWVNNDRKEFRDILILVDGVQIYRNQKLQKMFCDQSESSVANFIQKSFQILENKEYEAIIHWMANGRQFAIKEIDDFQEQILPKYFRHRNINSFIRQLNMYGFHKSRKDPSKNIFSHPYFLRGQPQILHLVKRKIKNEQKAEQDLKASNQSSIKQKNNQNAQSSELISKRSFQSFNFLKEIKENEPKINQKELVVTKTQIAPSLSCLSYKSFGFQNEACLFKGFIQKSRIMDSNPDLYLRIYSQNNLCDQEDQQIIDDCDDDISIQDEIERQLRVFQNRRSGISILQTYNLLNDFDLQ